jgi:putative hydrolase of the HAD superfamily
MNIKVIAFDADDTLWVSETYFQETERRFCELLEQYMPRHSISRELLQVEVRNLPVYGYGIKGYILSMIEAALQITDRTIDIRVIDTILAWGKEMLAHPVELLEGVEEVLTALRSQYRLVVATKGDLLDQERKLKMSGLEHYFHHIEIMSDKREADYQKLIKHLDIPPEEFMMVGNSLRSDVLPVVNIGSYSIHVPFHTTWAHEHVEHHINHPNFRAVAQIKEILPLLLV